MPWSNFVCVLEASRAVRARFWARLRGISGVFGNFGDFSAILAIWWRFSRVLGRKSETT